MRLSPQFGYSHPCSPEERRPCPSAAWSFLSTTKSYLKEVQTLRLKNKLKTPATAGKKPKSRFSPRKGCLLCLPQFHDVPAVYPAGLCCGCMDKSHGNHEGRLQPDCSHLHRGSDCHRFGGPADDELLPLRTHGGREPGMAETYLHHLGNLKQPGVYHGLHHSVLCRRQVERLTGISYGRSDYLWVS